jgi:hypothetical protein
MVKKILATRKWPGGVFYAIFFLLHIWTPRSLKRRHPPKIFIVFFWVSFFSVMTQGLVVDRGKTCIFLEILSRPVLDATHPKTQGKQENYTYAYSYRDIGLQK